MTLPLRRIPSAFGADYFTKDWVEIQHPRDKDGKFTASDLAAAHHAVALSQELKNKIKEEEAKKKGKYVETGIRRPVTRIGGDTVFNRFREGR